jgi:hypothetical protein
MSAMTVPPRELAPLFEPITIGQVERAARRG